MIYGDRFCCWLLFVGQSLPIAEFPVASIDDVVIEFTLDWIDRDGRAWMLHCNLFFLWEVCRHCRH